MIIQNGVGITTLLNGNTVKQALDPANETVARGIYNPTTLSAVDGDLATANIKNGITLFGFAGDADVRDISDATAIAAEVITGETFYAVSGGRRTGTMPTVALAPGSNAYPAGYHAGNVGGLDAVDLDLVTANIKNGITIFNVVGSVDVRDVSDANALVGEVMNARTFYAVGGARKTGTLATRTLNPANETVQAGYYAATTLSTVEVNLAAANILSGVNIFGFVGVATVQDIADADAVLADVMNGKTFYSVTGGRKTGNLATVALAAGANAYPAGYHVGAASLTAVDGDLVAGNIADGVTIFGVLGTLAPGTLAQDVLGDGISGLTATHTGFYRSETLQNAGVELTLATTTDTYNGSSRAVAVGHVYCSTTHVDKMKLRLYMGGVQVAESGYLPLAPGINFVLTATRALSGSQECKIVNKNYHTAGAYIRMPCMEAGSMSAAAIGIGSIKLV